ncbi:MAG: c-type cytochrome [bacterium]
MKSGHVKWVITTVLAIIFNLALSTSLYAQEANHMLGKALYEKECAICHNSNGKGDGFAAPFLDPKPRDFTTGVFKIRSTISLATNEDLFRTITRGIPGTLMPSFEYLSDDERWDLVAYVKNFDQRIITDPPKPITIPEPPPLTQQLLAQGEILYKDAGCIACHGQFGKGDGLSASTLKDEWGYPIPPYDFTVPGRMKGGSTVEDVYRALYVGIGGTPMPAFEDALSDEQYWAIVYYVLSLAEEVPSNLPQGNSIIGRDLFTGSIRFENEGPACIACHSVTGIGALGGGVMGPDLTRSYKKFSEYGITTILTDFFFPVMNPLFSDHSLTTQEQAHLISFFQQAMAERPAEAIGQLAILAGGGAVLLLLLMHLIWRRRLSAVRLPLVEQSA